LSRIKKNWTCFSHSIVWEHWPDTHKFITQSSEFWNRWIRLSCYYNRRYI